MIRFILALSLFLLPVLGPLQLGPIVHIPDTGDAKEFLILMSIVAMGLSGFVWRAKLGHAPRRPQNPFLFLLILFIPLSIYSSPKFKMFYGPNNMGGIWMWEATFWIFAYFWMYQSIVLVPMCREYSQKMVVRAIGWAAIISSGYAYLQALRLDQWQFVRPMGEVGVVPNGHISAMLDNPTMLGVWLSFCLPVLMLFFKKRFVFLVAGAILLTKSIFAIAGMVFCLAFVPALRARRTIFLKAIAVAGISSAFALCACWGPIQSKFGDISSGRIKVWKQTIEDWRGPCLTVPEPEGVLPERKVSGAWSINEKTFALTGRGPGSFPYIFSTKHATDPNWPSNWKSPHNVYLLSLYSIGLIGTVLLLLALSLVLCQSFYRARENKFSSALYSSIVYICLAAVGTPILSSPTITFYTVASIAMLSPRKLFSKKV